MRQDHVNYTAVGGFVLAMALLLAFVMFRITGSGGDVDTYYVDLRRIAGINNGSQVTFSGYAIGQVEDIVPVRIEGRTRYKLQISVRDGWPIPEDSFARIDAPSMLSEFVLEITEGKSTVTLKPGQSIKGKESLNIMSTISAMGAEVNDLSTNSLQPLIDNLNNQLSAIGPNIENGIPKVLDNVNGLLHRLQTAAESVQSLLSAKNKDHLDSIFANADNLSTELLKMSNTFKRASTQLNDLLKQSNALVARNNPNIEHAVSELRNSLDTVSESIQSIVYNFETTTRNLSEFSRQLRDNPSVLISGKPPLDKGEQHH